MPDPLCKDIHKVDHPNETLKKIRRYRMTEDFSQLVGMDVPLEIENIRQGLLHGSTDSFLELAEYMWMELARDNSVLRGPFRTFIEKNKLIRLIPPTPLISIVFLFSGEETLKEWCIINVCELYNTPNYLSGMVTGGTFFYKIHKEIVQETSRHKERNFLKSLFIFAVLGGSLIHPHYALFEERLNSLSGEISIKFNIYKVLVAGEVSITGEVKRSNKVALDLITKLLYEITNMQLHLFLAKNRQETSDIKMMLLFTTWEMLELGIKIDICKHLKLSILKSGLLSNNGTIRKRLYASVVEMYMYKGVSLLDLFRYGLLEYVLAQAEYKVSTNLQTPYNAMIRSLVIDTVALINTYKIRTQEISPGKIEKIVRADYMDLGAEETEAIIICSCKLWRDRMSVHSDYTVSAFVHLLFFHLNTRITTKYSKNTAIMSEFMESLTMTVGSRLGRLDRSAADERDRVIIAAVLNKKYSDHTEPVKIEILLDLIKECTCFYECTGNIPEGMEGLCGVIEKYINSYITNRVSKKDTEYKFSAVENSPQTDENISEECNILNMLYEMVQMPIIDPVLSQINYIVLHLDTITSDTTEIDFTWIRKLNLKRSLKINLKMTFLKNLFDKYLLLARDNKLIIKSVMNDIQRIQKENNLKEDEAMKRLFKRAERILEKKKEHTVESTTKDILFIPQTQNITTWQKPINKVRQEIQTNRDFILSLLRNEEPSNYLPVKPTYSTFLEYFTTYSPLVIKESIASIQANIAADNIGRKAIDGLIVGKHDEARTTTLTVYTRNKQALFINDIVTIFNKNDGQDTQSCTGLVVYEKEGQYDIMVCTKTLEMQGRYYKISIQPLINITPSMREYDGLIRLQQLHLRHKMLNPAKCDEKESSTAEGLSLSQMHALGRTGTSPNILSAPCARMLSAGHPLVSAFYDQLNKSQQVAVSTALKKNITLIQGPPGTGKTKTVSSMIAYFLLQNCRVLVCAPSNAAVDMLVESGSIWKTIPDCKWIRISISGNRICDEGDEAVVNKGELMENLQNSPSLVQSINVQTTPNNYSTDPKNKLKTEKTRESEHTSPNVSYTSTANDKFASVREPSRKENKDEINRAQLVFCTLSMAGSSVFNQSPFDVLIIDEACQATEPSTLIPLRTAPTRIILVGDPMQLPPTIISQSKDLSVTLFERLSESITPILLDTQYRMNSIISKFASMQFYENRLRDGVSLESELPFAFIDASGTEETEGKDIFNRKEINVILQFSSMAAKAYDTVGIISPYKGQVGQLKKVIKGMDISTVDGFQGQEKDCIIISTVRSKKIGFLNDIRRMNVALTRARYTVIIVGSMSLLQQDPTWKSLIKYVQENNFVYKAGEVYSILKSIKDKKNPQAHQ
ncbi:hypothetical protein NERG_00782 [Nematocida ausubeli]|uniref:Helicase ATP-binding domain-containing protein n=1 Tax=Nematocida ausubeli (strain ATCC PRA-371 / ERTm2) TaxID=1913371 RepID=H8ZB33_NEMA1|nr:hypothetical protein NERG_00782 [Nematocida ausubeli]